MSTNEEQWERFLDPDVVRPSLFMAAMFITGFEILKNSIIDHLRDFYSIGFSAEGESPEYKEKVLSRSRSPVYASLDWLYEHQVLNDNDLNAFEKLRETRNLVAHQLFKIVTGQSESSHSEQFQILLDLLRKIEVWWVENVELATDPEYVDKEIDENDIVPGAILTVQMLLEVASGNTELLEAWRNQKKAKSVHRA